jgi:hypothetical protein
MYSKLILELNIYIYYMWQLKLLHKIFDFFVYFYIYLFTYVLHGAGYSWKADSHSACQKIACFLYGTRRLITIFTYPHHWTLS